MQILVLPSVPQVQAILLVLASQGRPGDLVYPWTENIDYNGSYNTIPTEVTTADRGQKDLHVLISIQIQFMLRAEPNL